MLFETLGYQRLLSLFFVASNMDPTKDKKKITKAEERLLKMTQGSEELEMLWRRTCADVSVVMFKEV